MTIPTSSTHDEIGGGTSNGYKRISVPVAACIISTAVPTPTFNTCTLVQINSSSDCNCCCGCEYCQDKNDTGIGSPVQNDPAWDSRLVQKRHRLRQLDSHGQPADRVAPDSGAPLEGVLQRASLEPLQQEERRRRRLSLLDVGAGPEGAGDVGVSASLGDLPVDGDLSEEVLRSAATAAGGRRRLGYLEHGVLPAVDTGADHAEASLGEGLDLVELGEGHILVERQ